MQSGSFEGKKPPVEIPLSSSVHLSNFLFAALDLVVLIQLCWHARCWGKIIGTQLLGHADLSTPSMQLLITFFTWRSRGLLLLDQSGLVCFGVIHFGFLLSLCRTLPADLCSPFSLARRSFDFDLLPPVGRLSLQEGYNNLRFFIQGISFPLFWLLFFKFS